MRFTASAVLVGIASSKGEFESSPGNTRAYDSTTFHLAVDLGEKSTGETIGQVTRPFKLGTSTEFAKWKGMKSKWPVGGIEVEATFEVAAGAENSSKLTLIDIKPKAQA